MANYPQELAQDAVCQSHTGHMTGLWFLPTRPLRLNTNEWMNEYIYRFFSRLWIMCVFYIFGQLYFRIRGFTWKRKIVSCFECFCWQWKKFLLKCRSILALLLIAAGVCVFFQTSRSTLRPTSPVYSNYRWIFPGGKAIGARILSPPSCVKVKND